MFTFCNFLHVPVLRECIKIISRTVNDWIWPHTSLCTDCIYHHWHQLFKSPHGSTGPARQMLPCCSKSGGTEFQLRKVPTSICSFSFQKKQKLETLPTTTNSFTDFVVLLVIYRVIHEEQSIYWEVTVLVIVKKNVHMNMGYF